MISTPRAPTGSYSLKSAHVTRDPYPLYSRLGQQRVFGLRGSQLHERFRGL
jgi:hypothetical protein